MVESRFDNRNSVRFGWAQAGHGSIRRGAFNRAGLSPELRQVLASQSSAIAQADDAQDLYYQGPHHFINSETGQSASVPPSDWPTVDQWFSPQRKAAVLASGMFQPLPAGNNVVTAVLTSYNQLVKAFRNWRSTGAGLPEVSRAIGQLAHYVGDLLMPLHVTSFHTWPVMGTQTRDMHAFIEQELFSRKDYDILSAIGGNAGLVPLNPTNLPTFLSALVKDTYARLFDLAAIQRSQPSKPKKTLLQQLMAGQVFNAQTVLSSLLQSAWDTARNSSRDSV